MEKNKLNILFDATTIFNNFYVKKSSRSGIFFVAYNILKEMLMLSDINIELYCDNYNSIICGGVLKEDPLLKNCKMANIYNRWELLLCKLKYLRYKNRRMNDPKSKTIFMIIKRILIKTCFYSLKLIFTLLGLIDKGDNKLLEKFDVYFSPVFKPPVFIVKNNKIKEYTIIYDTIPLVFPEFYPGMKKKNYFYRQFINSINKNAYYFAISQNTKKDFIKYVPQIDGEKITTTLLAASENFYRCENNKKNIEVRKKYKIPQEKKYILSLCSLEPRKNLIFAIKNFIKFIKANKINNLVFVLGGGHWDEFIEKLNKEINDLGEYKDKIIKAGYIDDEDLASLYSHAEMFVYPSIYEGFGLPPLEAMQCGCPVITSNVTSIPEVIGNAGIMIDPNNDDGLINAYEEIYFNESLKKELSQKGMQKAKEFSWKKCVDIMVNEMIKNQEIKS